MLDPQFFSEPVLHHIPKLELPHHEDASPWRKPFENTLRAPAPAKKNLSGEDISELGLGLHSMEGSKACGNPRRVCRICHRQFSSGRALGGHMRVHGPLFIPAAGRKRKLVLTDSDSEGEGGEEEEAVLHAAASLSIEVDSPRMTIAVDLVDGDAAGGDDYHGVGTEYYMAAHDREHGSICSVDFSKNSELVDDDSTAKKNALYELRHNPKKSRKFTDEDVSTKMLALGHGMPMSLSSKGSVLPPSESTRVCSVCGKGFWSWKALSGHMRCHPEREWRGVLPPAGKAGSRPHNHHKRSSVVSSFGESSDVERDSDVEYKDDLEAGTGLTLILSKKLFEEEENLQDGADVKLCVSSPNTTEYDSNSFWPTGKRSKRRSGDMKAGSLQSSSPQEDQGDAALIASEATSFADLGEEQHFQGHNFLFMLAEAARTIEGGVENKRQRKQGGSNMFVFKGNSTAEQDGQAFLVGLKDARNAKAGTMKFECFTCKRSFNSPQALGGHRASHRKMKGCFARTSMGEEESAEHLGHELAPLTSTWHGPPKERDSMKKEKQQQQVHSHSKGYECSLCHRVFSTGQALGGHKSRCHFTGEKVAEAAASVMSSNKQLPGRGHSSKHDDGNILDLNLPVSTIEDGEVGSEAAVELNLFTSNHVSEVNGKVDKWTTDSTPEELSLGAPWAAAKHLSRSTSWELEGRWPAVEPAMAF